MTSSQRAKATSQWLITLTPKQIRALACQHKVEGWNTRTIEELKLFLVAIPEVRDIGAEQ